MKTQAHQALDSLVITTSDERGRDLAMIRVYDQTDSDQIAGKAIQHACQNGRKPSAELLELAKALVAWGEEA